MNNISIALDAHAQLPTRFGDFQIDVFRSSDQQEHVALRQGNLKNDCLVRMHSECVTGDIFRSLRCDCGEQIDLALQKINDAGCGLLIYLRGHEGRGIGLSNKIKAYALQEEGFDTVDANLKLGFKADERNYAAGIAIVRYYGLGSVALLTNNAKKISALEAAGIRVSAQIPIWTASNPHNEQYLKTKRDRMDHIG